MLTINGSVGVTPEVNQKNPLHAGNKVHKPGIHPVTETQGKAYQKSKNRGITDVPPSQIFF